MISMRSQRAHNLILLFDHQVDLKSTATKHPN